MHEKMEGRVAMAGKTSLRSVNDLLELQLMLPSVDEKVEKKVQRAICFFSSLKEQYHEHTLSSPKETIKNNSI